MTLPSLFAILGPLSDPDFDIVEDYYPTSHIIEVMNGPKYLLMCTATQDLVQVIDFIEDTKGEIRAAKKVLTYTAMPNNITLKQNSSGKAATIKCKKTNMFLSRETIGKGYTSIPIYTLSTRKELWYFPIDKKFKRSLTTSENQQLCEGLQA